MQRDSLEIHKGEAFIAAVELGYDKETLEKICAAKTEVQVQNIMVSARRNQEKYILWDIGKAVAALIKDGVVPPRITTRMYY